MTIFRKICDQKAINPTLEVGISYLAVMAIGVLFTYSLVAEKWWAVAALGLTSLAPLFLRWPLVCAFGTYAFLVPFDAVAVVDAVGGSTITRMLGIITGAIFLAVALVDRSRFVRPPRAAVWWCLLVVWAVLTAAWALDLSLVFQRVPTVLSVFLLYLVSVSIKPSRKEFIAVCALTVIGGMSAAGVGYFFQDPATEAATRGTLVVGQQAANPNTLAAALILPLALAIGGYLSVRGASLKAATLVAVGVIGVGIYMTVSRKALFAMAIMMVSFAYRVRKPWRLLVIVIVLLSATALMPQIFSDRIELLLSGDDTTGSGRTDIWGVGLRGVADFGFFGAGLNNFTQVYARYAIPSPRTLSLGAHNTYLGTWVELGIVGLLLMVAALGTHLFAAYRSKANGVDDVLLRAIESACLGMILIAFFADALWSKDFWLPFILLTWAGRISAANDTSANVSLSESISLRTFNSSRGQIGQRQSS
jgi:O-antigen ligase